MKIFSRYENREHEYEYELSEQAFVLGVIRAWKELPHCLFNQSTRLGWDEERGESPPFFMAPACAYRMFFSSSGDVQYDRYWCYFKPIIRVREYGQNWLVIRYNYDWRGGKEYEDPCYLFAFRHTPDDDYGYIEVPEYCRVEEDSGDIIVHFEGRDLPFANGEKGWPAVLLNPSRWIALGLANRLLLPENSNPLTMLLKAKDSLASGAAAQVIRDLKLLSKQYQA